MKQSARLLCFQFILEFALCEKRSKVLVEMLPIGQLWEMMHDCLQSTSSLHWMILTINLLACEIKEIVCTLCYGSFFNIGV